MCLTVFVCDKTAWCVFKSDCCISDNRRSTLNDVSWQFPKSRLIRVIVDSDLLAEDLERTLVLVVLSEIECIVTNYSR
jgi:hypothetical protein